MRLFEPIKMVNFIVCVKALFQIFLKRSQLKYFLEQKTKTYTTEEISGASVEIHYLIMQSSPTAIVISYIHHQSVDYYIFPPLHSLIFTGYTRYKISFSREFSQHTFHPNNN